MAPSISPDIINPPGNVLNNPGAEEVSTYWSAIRATISSTVAFPGNKPLNCRPCLHPSPLAAGTPTHIPSPKTAAMYFSACGYVFLGLWAKTLSLAAGVTLRARVTLSDNSIQNLDLSSPLSFDECGVLPDGRRPLPANNHHTCTATARQVALRLPIFKANSKFRRRPPSHRVDRHEPPSHGRPYTHTRICSTASRVDPLQDQCRSQSNQILAAPLLHQCHRSATMTGYSKYESVIFLGP